MNSTRLRYNASGARRAAFCRPYFFLYLLLAWLFPAALSAQQQIAKLGNLVWEDTNGDGIYQSGEPPIQGARINLLNMVGNPVQDVNGSSTAQTNAQGEYAFFVKPGTYVLQFVTPMNYTTSMKDQGGNDELDSDYNANNNNRTAPITIGPGGTDESIDAAFKAAARFGNLVWDDLNNDGIYQNGEPGISGATVNLLNSVGNPVLDVNGNSTVQTNAQGEYAFYVRPGTYVLQFVTPMNYTTVIKDQGGNNELDSDYDPNNNNRTVPLTLGIGGMNYSIDAAFKALPRPGSLGNFVWNDLNNDGVFQTGEPPITGAVVNLLDATGNPAQDLNGNVTALTNANGEYGFSVNAGIHIIQFVTPNGYATGAKDQGNDDQLDSDYDSANNNKTAPITIASGETNHSIDAGFRTLQVTATLGNLVWEDTNGDGIFQSGEPPIQGATVKLLDIKGKSEKDLNGNSKLQTNAQGEYNFHVKPGTYILKFTTPNGYTTSAKDQGNNDRLDSDYDPANGNETTPITIAAGQTNMDIDAAFKAPARLGNLVWEDLNGNSLFDTGEPAIQGATVKLLDAKSKAMKDENGNTTVQTNANGEYSFIVKPGVYILQFATPNGYAACAKDQGNNDELDSDYDPANSNKTSPVTITGGQINSMDGCFYKPAQLGNLVWEDMNGNGVFEASEPAIEGAMVKLLEVNGNPAQDVSGNSTLQTNAQGEYGFSVKPGVYILQFLTPNGYLAVAKDQGRNDQFDSDYDPAGNKTALITIAGGQTQMDIDAGFKAQFIAARLGNFVWEDLNGNGVFETDEPPIQGAMVKLLDASGNPAPDLSGNSTVQTNAQGEYGFAVKPGAYILQFPTPNGYRPCPRDQGVSDELDSDYNPNNSNRTARITISGGQTNSAIDACFKSNFVAATLGNLVWQDRNRDGVFQNGEPRIQGATVNLRDASGNSVKDVHGNATLQTNANGEYHFYVRPGAYILQFVTPNGYTTISNDRGHDETRDSDYSPTTGRTAPVTIASGQSNMNIDAAFYFCPATYIYSLSEEAQQQLTRIRLDRTPEQVTVIADKIIYGGAISGGQPISGFIVGKALGANTEAMAYDANTRTAYIISNKLPASVLLKLDLATGVARSIGFVRTAADSAIKPISALAFNNKTNALYGITANRLLKINPLNAQAFIYPRLITAEASIHLESASFDHTVDPPVLYAISKLTQRHIYTINLSTGIGAFAGKLPMSLESFDFGPVSGLMYAVAGGYRGQIYLLDRLTYAPTPASANFLIDGEGLAVIECVDEMPLTKDRSGKTDENVAAPTVFALHRNYPNPFSAYDVSSNAGTSLKFSLPMASHVRLSIYNLLGQLTRTLVDGETAAGQHAVSWNGRNQSGDPVPAGVYLYQIIVQDHRGNTVFKETKRLTVLK